MSIDADQIASRIPESARQFLRINAQEMPDTYAECVDAFIEAIEIIWPQIHHTKIVHAYIGRSPFVVPTGSATLRFETNNETIHCLFSDIIVFFDFKKIENLDYRFKVATILEEFCHTYMSIRDETLVSKVVAVLYERIALNEKIQYVLPPDVGE